MKHQYNCIFLFIASVNADYQNTTSVITLSAGSIIGDCECVNIPIIDDRALEAIEFFYITAELATIRPFPTSFFSLSLLSNIAHVAITDNDREKNAHLITLIILLDKTKRDYFK